jgi:hypothetical protein
MVGRNTTAGMDLLFVEVDLEISDNIAKSPPFNDAQKQKLARLPSKYDMEIRPTYLDTPILARQSGI